jgi:hypothetical protein
MLRSRRPISSLLMLASACFSGCRASGSILSPGGATATAVQASKLRNSLSSAQRGTIAPKHISHDSTLAEYHNPDYGVSFRYPRNFALMEQSQADSSDSSVAEAQQNSAVSQPGSELVATVSIPADSYPNTNFRGGTLQLLANPEVTPEICPSFAAPDSDGYGTTGTIRVQGINFDWHDRGSAGGGTGYDNREYAGFSAGVCYIFRIELVVSGSIDPDYGIKLADLPRIMGVLEKIVSSFQIYPKPASATAPKPLPIVHSFTVEPLPHPLLQNVVRVSWNISGAKENEVFLRANCAGPAELNPLPDSASPEPTSAQPSSSDDFSLEEPPDPYSHPGYYQLESIFSCGKFAPIPHQSGSFRVQIEPNSAKPVTFTLFVYRLNYITRAP